jgi:hypothetical protein
MQDWSPLERQDLVVDYSGGGVRYVLPRRELGQLRHAGWFVIGLGGFITAFMVLWMSGPIVGGINDLANQRGFGLFTLLFGCLGVFGLVPALGMLIAGFAIVLNRTSTVVELRNGVLRSKERLLLASWRRKRRAAEIKRLRIAMASEWKQQEKDFDFSKWLGTSEAALVAETTDGKDVVVAVVYPRELLLHLAEDLAPRLEAEMAVPSSTIDREPSRESADRQAAPAVDIVEGYSEEEEEVLVPPQPADSVSTIERRPNGITIDVPPVGIWKGSRGLMFFAIVWNGFISIFITFAVLGLTGAIEMEGDGPLWLLPIFLIPFVAVGIGTLLAAINMGRRRATIATADDLMMIVRHSIFGKKTKEWSGGDLDEICVGSSGMEVNDVPIQELQIHPGDGTKFGCLSQLDDEELRWIAGELNQALQLSARGPLSEVDVAYSDRDDRGRVMPALGSRVKVDYWTDGTRINVPARGFVPFIGGIVIGLIFMAIAAGVVIFVAGDELKDGIAADDLFTLGFIGLWTIGFGGGGAATFFACLVGARRRFEIMVDSYQLSVVRRGLLGSKRFTFARDDLEPIAVGDSGTEVNNLKHYQVSIRSRKGGSLAIMSGQDRADLALVATAINETLGLAKAETVPA